MSSSFKSGVFIDNGYFKRLLKDKLGGIRADYLSFSEKLCNDSHDGCYRFRTYYYDCPPYQSNPPTEEEKERKKGHDRFICKIQSLPKFEVRMGRLRRNFDRKTGKTTFGQKRVDLMIGVDMVELAAINTIDQIILVAGDDDLVPAVKVAKNHVNITLAYHYSNCSDELKHSCDTLIEITPEYMQDCLLR